MTTIQEKLDQIKSTLADNPKHPQYHLHKINEERITKKLRDGIKIISAVPQRFCGSSNEVNADGSKGEDVDLSNFPNVTQIYLPCMTDEERKKNLYRSKPDKGYLSTPLTSLNLSNCQDLEEIIIPNNQLKSLDFLNQVPNPEKVKIINVKGNPYQTGDNHILDRFKNATKKVFNIPNQEVGKIDKETQTDLTSQEIERLFQLETHVVEVREKLNKFPW